MFSDHLAGQLIVAADERGTRPRPHRLDKTIHIPVAEQILRLHHIPCMAHGGAVSVKPRLLGAEEEIIAHEADPPVPQL